MQADLNAQMAELTTALDKIQSKMVELQPRIRTLNEKINLSANHRIDLYNQSTSLDTELLLLLQQKETLEKDCNSGKDGLVQARKSWDGLRALFVEAKQKKTKTGTSSRVSQLDLPAATLFSPLPQPQLVIASAAEPQPEPSQIAASGAKGVTHFDEKPLEGGVDSADLVALAGASAQDFPTLFC